MIIKDHEKFGIEFAVRSLIKYDAEKYSNNSLALAAERVLKSELYKYVADARTGLFRAPIGCIVKAYDMEVQLDSNTMLNYIADIYIKLKKFMFIKV